MIWGDLGFNVLSSVNKSNQTNFVNIAKRNVFIFYFQLIKNKNNCFKENDSAKRLLM